MVLLTDDEVVMIKEKSELIQNVLVKLDANVKAILTEAQAGYNASWDARFLKIANLAQEALTNGSH